MEKRIALEKRGQPDNQITELILDNCRSTNIDGLTDNFTALEVLSLINVGLVSLKNFPKLPSLKKLELSDNRISSGLNNLTNSPKITHVNLSGNRVKEFDELKPLKDLENLEVLDLFNNEVTSIENYREKIFQLIPSLKYLDGFDKEDTEAPSDGEDDEVNGNGEEEVDDDDDDDAEGESSEFDEDDEDENDVSLAEVYNEDLEEDNSDWNEEGADDDDEDVEDPSDDDEAEAEGAEAEKASSDAEEETEASRGKKRKHDG